MTSIDSLLAEIDRQTEVARRERQAALLRLAGGASGAGDVLLRDLAKQHPWSLLAGAATGGTVLSGMGIRGPMRTALTALRSGLFLGLGVMRRSPTSDHPDANSGDSVPAGTPSTSSAQ